MKPLFAELDKFCDLIRGLPGANSSAPLKEHLDRIGISKEKIVLAQSETLAYEKMAQDQWKKILEASEQKKDEHRRRMEELNRPSAPLDGNVLGRALLKNLGFLA